MVTHHNEKIWIAMKDNDKRVALIRLRDIIYSGVRPTLRECGFSAENVEELVKEGLILPRGKMSGDESDRYVIEEILPAGHAFISQHHTFHDERNLPPVPG
jgi:hypothetical protein